MIVKIVIGAVVLAAGVFLLARRAGDVSSAEAHALVASGALLVDVRSPEEFASGHVAGALNVPVQQLPARLPELGAKDRAVVVYCRSGNRSAHAAKVLREAGFASVHNLGAMSRW